MDIENDDNVMEHANQKIQKKNITPTIYLAYQTVPHPTYLIVFFRSPS